MPEEHGMPSSSLAKEAAWATTHTPLLAGLRGHSPQHLAGSLAQPGAQ